MDKTSHEANLKIFIISAYKDRYHGLFFLNFFCKKQIVYHAVENIHNEEISNGFNVLSCCRRVRLLIWRNLLSEILCTLLSCLPYVMFVSVHSEQNFPRSLDLVDTLSFFFLILESSRKELRETNSKCKGHGYLSAHYISETSEESLTASVV